jgi:hypothetical protein
VTGVTLLAPQLTSENCAELLGAAKHKTAEEIRRLLADRCPKPDVRASVRLVPAATASAAAGSSAGQKSLETPAPNRAASDGAQENEFVALGRGSPGPAAPADPSSPQGDPATRARTEPLGGERYCVRFTAGPEMHGQLQELRALMRHLVKSAEIEPESGSPCDLRSRGATRGGSRPSLVHSESPLGIEGFTRLLADPRGFPFGQRRRRAAPLRQVCRRSTARAERHEATGVRIAGASQPMPHVRFRWAA